MQPMPHRPVRVPYTYEHYRLLPDDGRRYEVIGGDLYVSPSPTSMHQTISRRLMYRLMTVLEQTGHAVVFNAPMDLILGDTTIVQPDLIIVSASRKHIISERGIEGVPDVVVEILSPSTRANDVILKRGAYARCGIPEYWVVDPETSRVEVLRLGEADYELVMRYDRASTLLSPAFAEVQIDLAQVFAPL